jgi:class 3 adenylate cyclase/tetratricopeptide (TPR) repeat protein
MQSIAEWLEELGLGEYAQRFAENGIDLCVLGHLSDQDLKDLGVLLGHRRKLQAAIAGLQGAAPLRTETAPITKHDNTAERRQLTVLFCDLVGSTALSARLDPEDLRAIIDTYHRRSTEVIVKHGGFVARYMGDGVLAYFGYPQADEDDAERAVRSGLALAEVASKIDFCAQADLQVRVGIATGLVVVGDLLGEGAAHDHAVIGETPNLAARLQGLAEPGAVIIDSKTRLLLGQLFEYHALGPLAVKGFDGAVTVWQVLNASAIDSRFEALRASATPLVGRNEEIDLLMRRWDQAKRGEGCVVLICGEPGIGKSRITQTVLERLSTEPHTRLRSFCSPHHRDSALYPTITRLKKAAGFGRGDTVEQQLNKLEAMLGQATDDLGDAVPLLAALLSIPTGHRYPPLDLGPQAQKEKTLNALLAQIEGLALKQPVLMVWEDVQWVDPTSRDFLDLTIDRTPSLPILLIITYRPEFAGPWVGRSQVTLVTLNRLPPRRCAEMIAYVTAGKPLPKEVTDQIIDRTDGVPLYIEELTKAVVESGVLIDVGDHYTVAGPLPPLAIPTSLNASLLARLDRLGSARDVAQIAAALGREFSYELINAVSAIPQPRLDDALAQLVCAELVFQRGAPPHAEYTFKHTLVQDAAYNALLRSRRQQLHTHIVATLEARFPEIALDQPALLARHCTEAGLIDKAVAYWLTAQALTPTYLSGTNVAEILGRTRALAEQTNRPEHLLSISYVQWAFHLIRSEHKLALSLAEQLEKIGKARNDVVAQLLGRREQGVTRCYLGEFITARAVLEQCHALSEPAHRAIGTASSDPYAMMLAQLAVTLAHLGYIDQARVRLNEAISEARRLGPSLTLPNVLFRASWIESIIRSGKLKDYVEELQLLSTEHGLSLFLGKSIAIRGLHLTLLGQAQEGVALLIRGLTAVRATGAVANTPQQYMWLAEAHAMLGQLVEGLNCLAEAAQIIKTTGERHNEAEMLRLRGNLLYAAGDQSAAEESYHQALAVAKRQSAKLWELLGAASLARLWRDQGKRTEARDLLAPVYGWFTEGFDTSVLRDGKALLDELT